MLVNANTASNHKFILAVTLSILAASFSGSYNEANGNLLFVFISLLIPLYVTNMVSHIFGPSLQAPEALWSLTASWPQFHRLDL